MLSGAEVQTEPALRPTENLDCEIKSDRDRCSNFEPFRLKIGQGCSVHFFSGQSNLARFSPHRYAYQLTATHSQWNLIQ